MLLTASQQRGILIETSIPPQYRNPSVLPFPPCLTHHKNYDEFFFSLWPLPSINYKHDRQQRVVPAYRKRELEEIRRIELQRDMVGWTISKTDRYLLLYLFSFTSMRQDVDNRLKSTTDLLGEGRWETIQKVKVFVPHAYVIYNDNRVMNVMLEKVIQKGKSALWDRVHLIRYHEQYTGKILHRSIINDILERYE